MRITFESSILFLFMLLPVVGCIQNTTATTTTSHQKTEMGKPPETTYYVDDNADGVFEKIIPVEEPVPFQGKEEFRISLHSLFKYPPSAREKGIEGFVVLEILIDEFGFVKEVNVKKSLTSECDEVVKNAFLKATQNGYAQLKWNSSFVKYKMDYPFGFYLQ